MNAVRKFLATATLPVKAFMAISVISAAAVLNKTVISPYFKRLRYKQSEEWANMVFEAEERQKAASDRDGSNNISF